MILPKAYQVAFMDGFETIVVILCAVACGFAAARSSPVARGLWVMAAVFFVLTAAGDLHDFLVDVDFGTGRVPAVAELLGWCMYLSLALLVFFPVEREGKPDWNWIPFLDFLLVTTAVALTYFRFIYLPHFMAGQAWTVSGPAELTRDVLISSGLLLRSGVDPSPQARGVYRRIGGVFAAVVLLRVAFPGYTNPVFALSRPALWLVLGTLAAYWRGITDDKPAEDERRIAMRLVMSLFSAATLIVVVVIAHDTPAPYGGLTSVIAATAAVVFILRTSLAEHSRHAAETRMRSSEQDYRVLFESAIAPIVIFEPVGERILQANSAACELYGMPREALIGASLKDFTKDIARGEREIAELLRTGSHQKLESVHRRRDGKDIVVVLSSSVIQYQGRKAVLCFVRDISERKEAEARIRDSEERFRTLVENATVGIYRTAPDGRILMANPALVKMLGYDSFEELARRNLEQRGFEPDYPRAEFRTRLGRESEVRGLEAAWTRRDGTSLFVRESARVSRGPDGEVLHYDGIVEDVTERKLAEERIKESEEKFRKAFMTGADAFYIATLKEGRIFEVNDRFKDVFGYSREEAIGKTSVELGLYVDPDDRQKIVSGIRSKGFVHNLELQGRKKAGELITVLVSANVLHGEGEPVALGVVRDITEQKSAQESLVRLRQAVDASGEVIFMTDREGIITLINPEFTKLYGYTPEEIVGKATPRILKSGVLVQEEYERMWETLLAGQVARGEVVNRTRDGRLVNIASSVNPIHDENGRIAGFLAIQRDVTGQKSLEEQLRQSQKMEAVGRLAGGVAHDFNNLLSIINGYSQLALACPDIPEPAREQIGLILQSGERAASLTRQLLAFSRKQVLEEKVLDLNGVLEGMDEMLRRLIGEDIELRTIPGRDLGRIKADPNQIEQVIMNLAVNARDAMPRGGKLTIETGNTELNETYAATHVDVTPGWYVTLSISDTGAGMDEETKAHIFEPFFTTKGLGKGTGLGLSTVYGIVSQTGGHVSVHSEPGQGTTFRVYLPRLEAAVVGAAAAVEVESTLPGSETILVVEDEPYVGALIKTVLARQGYTILITGSPAEAEELCAKHKDRIHLLLTDVIMPGDSGKALADKLAPARPDMKVLFISGYTADAIADHGVLDEKTNFLPKPFTLDALLRKVRETLDKKV